jgi:major intracellular serine protease
MIKILVAISLFCGLSQAADTTTTKEYVVWSKSKRAIPFAKLGLRSTRTLRGMNGAVLMLTETQARSLKNVGVNVELNGRMSILGAPSKVQPKRTQRTQVPWGIEAVQAPKAHALSNEAKGEGATVCVVDTGIDNTHPALKDRVVGGVAIVKSSVVGQEEWFDDQSHGTHVSGTIAGQASDLLGVAPNAKLFAVKVLSKDGSGSYDGVAEGILACIGKAEVINLSLGGPQESLIVKDAVLQAYAAGLKLSCAAGNSYGPIGYPALYDECTTISAIDVNNKLGIFSSRGKQVDFAAPGVKITSSVPNGKYADYDGTSMAAPHVAGVMAIQVALKKAGLAAVDIGLKPEHQGKGRIDAYETAK